MTSEQLDMKIERWFSEQFDFEIADASAKLERFGVVKSNDGQHIAFSISAAQLQLDTQ
jgi:hypothetical protein